MVQRPEIIAHRGASQERPENTIAAFRRAAELGADAVELDVHLSCDHTLFVHHDAVPHQAPHRRLVGRAISSLTDEQLALFRVEGEPIPSLRQVLDATGDQLVVYCELKGAGTALAAVTLLDDPRWNAAVHAFDHRQVATARQLAPGLSRGVLEASYHLDPTSAMAAVDARDLWQHWELIDGTLVQAVHERGGRVVAWTVNHATEMQRLARLGVDGLCTDDVALARRTLAGNS